MRIDIITIFPEFFSVLDVSLVGKARQSGLIDLRVHNLRDHTHDRHHSVDDTPYGGGAGMVMKPEPWGDAIDDILTHVYPVADLTDAPDLPTATDAGPLLIFPSPAGELFTQAMARKLAEEPNLIFGCGRYEGIDQRVFDHFAEAGRVRLVSLGDYVLNGGEVAVMAMIEAVGRLIPGVVGNPESLVEESHEDGLLEYPSYTKPAAWRGRDVPPVLLSGNHGAIAAWRREQQLERTARVRPDLLPPAN
ncbi:tRNA (guanosine(37)-N1)-methyltransferase TrmD [Cryobacterium sinapicolor]|uniref:tRNA (guanine-N(1)-)-methyltransferase n=1 Tax=Cryobacterium sinapicolor TaxID=1259236 RepID=A0ABY2IXG3_9MICO|nr:MULTISPECIES: tRNA (guanosine(37)-N1)-methyltransferase TrmD [Cryobacterium]TFC90585.1 tRNA (guanosine(37)-N1)-methyltransferase TrmD [Cryobacterium sp. TMT3-29-2]TFC95881.1 tRNA (guanosine(37)-N1)-methyltransferase TrmD [Cryobacterium sinapicolor]